MGARCPQIMCTNKRKAVNQAKFLETKLLPALAGCMAREDLVVAQVADLQLFEFEI